MYITHYYKKSSQSDMISLILIELYLANFVPNKQK